MLLATVINQESTVRGDVSYADVLRFELSISNDIHVAEDCGFKKLGKFKHSLSEVNEGKQFFGKTEFFDFQSKPISELCLS